MDANQNPPSERDWTIEEQEAFYAKVEIPYGEGLALGNAPDKGSSFMNNLWTEKGIHVTSLVPPESGWPIALYCPLCKVTTFLLSPWAIKPTEADYIKMNDTCGNEVFCHQHNMELAMRPSRAAVPKNWLEEF